MARSETTRTAVRAGGLTPGPAAAGLTRRQVIGGGVALLAAQMLHPRPAGAASGPAKQATLRFNWTIKGEFTPFFVAREKGFYAAENVTLQLLEGKSGTQAVEVVGASRDTFGYVPSVQVIEGVNDKIPLRTVAALGRYTGMCWASWPDVPLTTPSDLEGRRVSISPSSTFFQVWPAFARKFHIDVAKVDIVHVDPSARVGLFLSHKLDIMADIFWANDYVTLQVKAGAPLHVLRLSDLDFDPLGYLLTVNAGVLARDPDLVRRVVRATLRGFRYTMAHPGEATAIMTRLYGDRLGPKVLGGQVHNMIGLINTAPALGRASTSAWKASLDLLSTSGVIRKVLPLADYYTDEFVAS